MVQQGGGAVRAKLAVNQPGDRFEQEADQAARAVIQREQQVGSAIKPGAQLQRQVEEEEEEPVQTRFLQRQTDEEEEPVQARLLQRQVNEDDEAVQMQRLQRQTEDEEPIQTQVAQRQSEDEEPVQMMWIQRQAATATEPETVEAEPTEAEKAAALAAARVAEQLANQALAEGTNEVAKSQTALAEEKNVGQAAKQEAEARSPEVPAEAAYAAAAQTGGEEGEQPTGEMTDVMAIEPAVAPTTNGTGPATEIGPLPPMGLALALSMTKHLPRRRKIRPIRRSSSASRVWLIHNRSTPLPKPKPMSRKRPPNRPPASWQGKPRPTR